MSKQKFDSPVVRTLRDLARRGFILRDEKRETNQLHPQWVGVSKKKFRKALRESYARYPAAE